jgi:hypothetical protein
MLEALRKVDEQARAKLSEEAALGVAASVLLNLDAVWMHE